MTDQASPITEDDVRHVAKLSRLSLSDEQVQQFTHQLADVIQYVHKLNELDVENVEPLTRPLTLTNALRNDVESPGLSNEQALANAPEQDPPYFKVPKVLGDQSGA